MLITAEIHYALMVELEIHAHLRCDVVIVQNGRLAHRAPYANVVECLT
jgi:hypothetical protein